MTVELREQRLERLERERHALVAARVAAAEREREERLSRLPPPTLPGLEPDWSRGLADPPPA